MGSFLGVLERRNTISPIRQLRNRSNMAGVSYISELVHLIPSLAHCVLVAYKLDNPALQTKREAPCDVSLKSISRSDVVSESSPLP